MKKNNVVKKVTKKFLTQNQRDFIKSKFVTKDIDSEHEKNVYSNNVNKKPIVMEDMSQRLAEQVVNYTEDINNSEQKKLREYYASKFDTAILKDNQILYETRDGMSFTDSPKTIYEYLLHSEEFNNLQHVIVVAKRYRTNFDEFIANLPENVSIVYRNSFEYIDALLESKYLFNNSTFQSFFVKRDNQIYINTWHGTPLKKMGIDFIQANPKDMNNVRRNMLMADYLLSPNQHVTDMFLRAYQLNYSWQGKVLEGGLPRIDNLFNGNPKEIIASLKRDGLVIDENKKNIVYMPTWQGKDPQHISENMANDFAVFMSELTENVGEKFNVLIKVHPYQFKFIKNDVRLKDKLIPDKYDPNEILKITDSLITDFSSVFFDYLVTNKPIYFYNWNSDLYENDRGVYFKESELPGPVSHTLDELLVHLNDSKILKEFEPLYTKWKETFTGHETGNVTHDYVNYIFKEDRKSIKEVVEPLTGKKKLLFFRGHMGNNGITQSFINLLNNLDQNAYDITVFLIGSNEKNEILNMNALNENIRKVFYAGAANYTVDEYSRDAILKENHIESEIDKFFPHKAYSREVKRFFGNQSFDVAIDFSGYSYFFAKFIVATNALKKIVWLHNDLFEEANSKENHKDNLLGVFALYKRFDVAVSVSRAVKDDNAKKLNHYLKNVKQTYLPNIINIDNKEENIPLYNNSEISMELKKLEPSDESVKLYKTIDNIVNNDFIQKELNVNFEYTSIAIYRFNEAVFYKVFENKKYIGWISAEVFNFRSSILNVSYTQQFVNLLGIVISQGVLSFDNINDIIDVNYNDSVQFTYNEYVSISEVLTINNEIFYGIQLDKIAYVSSKDIKIFSNTNNVIGKITQKNSPHREKFQRPDKAFIKTSLSSVVIFNNHKLNSSYIAYDKQYKSIIFDISSRIEKNNQTFLQLKWFNTIIGWISEDNIEYVWSEEIVKINSDYFDICTKDSKQSKRLKTSEYHSFKLVDTKIINNEINATMMIDELFGIVNLRDTNVTVSINEFYIIDKDDKDHPEIFSTGKFVLIKEKQISSDKIKILLVIDGKELLINYSDINWDIFVHPRQMDLIKQVWPVSYFVKLKSNKQIYAKAIPNSLQSAQPKINTSELDKNQVFRVNEEYTSTTGSKYYKLISNDFHVGFINRSFTEVVTYSAYENSMNFEIERFKHINEGTEKNEEQNLLQNFSEKKSAGLIKITDKSYTNFYLKDFEYKAVKKIRGKTYFKINVNNIDFDIPLNSVKILFSNYLPELPIRLKDEDVVISTIGRLSPEKNQAELIKAFRLLVNKYGPSLKLVIMGEGPLNSDLNQLINELRLQRNVFLVGQQADVFKILKQTDYFVFPSLYEGQGMALLEAISLGIPSAGTNISTTIEILGNNEEYGYLTKGIDSIAIKEVIERLLNKNTPFEKFNYKEYNRKIIEKFYQLIN